MNSLGLPGIVTVAASPLTAHAVDFPLRRRYGRPRTAVRMLSIVSRTACEMATDQNSASLGDVDKAVPHAVRRWVGIVVPVIDSPKDPKTIANWASWVGVSRGALRGWCRTAGFRAGRSLSLARMLRVVVRYPEGSPENLLDFADARSLQNFLRLGRSEGPPCGLPLAPDELLIRQQWITDPLALRELEAALRARAASVDEGPTGR